MPPRGVDDEVVRSKHEISRRTPIATGSQTSDEPQPRSRPAPSPAPIATIFSGVQAGR